MDQDGDLDALSASQGKLVWYQNTDGNGSFTVPKLIHSEGYLTGGLRGRIAIYRHVGTGTLVSSIIAVWAWHTLRMNG